MTFSLLTTSEGVKMGKTVKGALWLDENKTTPYEFLPVTGATSPMPTWKSAWRF